MTPMDSIDRKRSVLVLAGAFGGLALVLQVLILRQLLVAFYGNELVIGVVMAGWLMGVFLGARVGGFRAGRARRLEPWLWVLPWVWIAVAGGLTALSFYLPALSGLSAGEVASLERILGWTLVMTAPGAFFPGWLFVLAGSYLGTGFPEGAPERAGVGATLFWAESAGSTAGLLLYTFVLIGRVGPAETLGLFSIPILAAQGPALARRKSRGWAWAGGWILVGLLLFGTGAFSRLDQAGDRLRFQTAFPGYELLESKDSPYQHLNLGSRGGEHVLFGNLSFLASWPDPYQYETLALFFLTETPSPQRILLAGQGPAGFIREFLKFGVEHVTCLALDPAETGMVAGRLPPDMEKDLDDPRLEIIHDDVRRFLQTRTDTFDLIVINAPDPDTAQANRLYTLDFFKEAEARLRPGGVLVTSISGAENYWGRELVSFGRSLFRTMKQVFPQVLVTPGDRHFFLAAKNPDRITDDPRRLGRTYEDRGYHSPYMTPESFSIFFPPTGTQYVSDQLSGKDPQRLNTDAAPLSYFLRLVWWARMTGRSWTRTLLEHATRVRTWAPWAIGLAIFPLVLILVFPSPARTAWCTAAQTGAVTMALQMLLITYFQNRFGVIYRDIGLVSALFMAGLTGGGLAGRLALAAGIRPERLLPWLEAGLAGLALAVALLVQGLVRIPVLFLVFGVGLSSGTEFALLFPWHLSDPGRPGLQKTLSRLEAADHGGAVIGALATGLILAPLVGLGTTALALALVKAAGGVAVWRTGRRN